MHNVAPEKKSSVGNQNFFLKSNFGKNTLYYATFSSQKGQNPFMIFQNGRILAGKIFFLPNQAYPLKVDHFLRKKIFIQEVTKFGLFCKPIYKGITNLL